MNTKEFSHWSQTRLIKELITNPLIEVGEHSYYAGYYGNGRFEDGCVRYLWGDEQSRQLFNPITANGWQLDRLIIGNYVCIAGGATIMMGGNHNHHPEWITVYPFEEQLATSYQPKGDTIIGNDVWIGANAMIMPGITIGDGAIIAAGAVVTKDVEAYAIMAGVPARLVKKRFSQHEIQQLQEIQWFNWPAEKVAQAIPWLSSGNIAELYAYHQRNS